MKNPFDLLSLAPKIQDPSSKIAVMLLEMDYHAIKAFKKNFPKIIEEEIDIDLEGICLGRNNFGFPMLKSLFPKLVEAGIPQYFNSYFKDFELKPLLDDPAEPFVFSIEDLRFGFIVWLVACGVSSVVFMIEVSWKFKNNSVRSFRDYIGIIWFLWELEGFVESF